MNTISLTDANLLWSPYNWYSNGAGPLQPNHIKAGSTWAQSNNPGAYLKGAIRFADEGTLALGVDVSPWVEGEVLPANYPILAWTIDAGPWQTRQLMPTDSSIELATDLPAGEHTFHIYFDSTHNDTNRWLQPVTNVVRITGLTVNEGSALIAPIGSVQPRPQNMLLYWDSIGEGNNALSDGYPDPKAASHLATFVPPLAEALGYEVGTVAFGASGYTSLAAGNIPHTSLSFDKYDSETSRLVDGLLSPIPDILLDGLGTNDGDALTPAAVQAQLEAYRRVAPGALLVRIAPFWGLTTDAIKAGVAAYQVAHPEDDWVRVVDLGPEVTIGLSQHGEPSPLSFDGLHPHGEAAKMLAEKLIAAIRPLL
jgi:lysophospholipase L1-like esterase